MNPTPEQVDSSIIASDIESEDISVLKSMGPLGIFSIGIFIFLAGISSARAAALSPCESSFKGQWSSEIARSRAVILIRRSTFQSTPARNFQIIRPVDWYSVTLTGNGPRKSVHAIEVEGHFGDYVKQRITLMAETASPRLLIDQTVSIATTGIQKKTVGGLMEDVYLFQTIESEPRTRRRPSSTAQTGVSPQSVSTKKEFASLSEENKIRLLEFGGLEANAVSAVENVRLEQMTPEILRLAKKAIEEIKLEMSFEVDTNPMDSGIVSVGPIIYSFRVVTLKGTGELLGLTVDVRQDGGQVRDEVRENKPEDDLPSHYQSESAAREAGVDTSADVAWSGVAILDFSGATMQSLRMDPALEWSGW